MALIIAGTFLALHGIAHAVGFTASWQVVTSPETPYMTALLNGSVVVGDAGARVFGVLWLLAAVCMMAAGVQVARGSPYARGSLVAATAFSLALCLAGLPASAIGLVIDIAILAVVGFLAGLDARRRRVGPGAVASH
jgi:hypothetical protein